MAEETVNVTPAPEPYAQFEVKQFTDTNGRNITAFFPLNQESVEPRFVGSMEVTVRLKGKEGKVNITTGLAGNTIEEAFAIFDENKKKAEEQVQKEMEAEMNKPKIIQPGMQNLPNNMIQGNFRR